MPSRPPPPEVGEGGHHDPGAGADAVQSGDRPERRWSSAKVWLKRKPSGAPFGPRRQLGLPPVVAPARQPGQLAGVGPHAEVLARPGDDHHPDVRVGVGVVPRPPVLDGHPCRSRRCGGRAG